VDKNVIRVRDLSYTYPDGNTALQDVTFSVEKNESIGIIGNTGSGKTTLLLTLNGILKGSGTIRIMNIPLNSKNLKKIRQSIGIVFQRPDDQLFCPTVFDDVAFGPLNMKLKEREVKKRVKDSLKKVGMEGYEDRSSHHLSEGEKKKISLAGVLAMDPPMIAFDEPTANLDPRSRKNIINVIKECHHTKLIVSHDLDMIFALCSRIILLREGQIKFDGKASFLKKHKQILRKNELI